MAMKFLLSPIQKAAMLARAVFADSKTIETAHERLFAPLLPIANKKTDVAVVMGGTGTSGEVARAALHGYEDGRFDKIIVAGGAPAGNKRLYRALRLFNRAAVDEIQLTDFFNDMTEAEYMRQVLIELGVPEQDIEVAGGDQKHADKIIEFVLKSEFMRKAGSATFLAYGPYAMRARATARFQGFEKPAVAMPVSFAGMKPENWGEHLMARLYVLEEARNMDPARKASYIGRYAKAPDHGHERALIEALPDLDIAA